MINTVEIVSGHYQGSTQLLATCDEADDSVIVVYKFVNGVKTLIGTGLLGNDGTSGEGIIELTEPIVIGNLLTGYLTEFGNQGGQPVVVYENTTNDKTGWRVPQTVTVEGEEISYTAYLNRGGLPIADIYAPQLTVNNTVDRTNESPTRFIDFTLELTYTTAEIESEVVNVCVATVKGFNNAIGNPRVSWDGASVAQVYQKTYVLADNGTHEVEVFPESNEFQSKSISFVVNVVDAETVPTIEDIWSASYGVNPVSDRTVFLSAYSNRQLESRLLILGTESFTLMSSLTGSRWQQNPLSYNVPTGNYVGEIRVQGTTDVLTVDVRVTF